jgi:hypothetical protein
MYVKGGQRWRSGATFGCCGSGGGGGGEGKDVPLRENIMEHLFLFFPLRHFFIVVFSYCT